MSYHTIVVTPADGYFGFNVKYDAERITIPGFDCSFADVKVELPAHLEELGCSDHQIEVILRLMREKISFAIVDEHGDLEEDEEDEIRRIMREEEEAEAEENTDSDYDSAQEE